LLRNNLLFDWNKGTQNRTLRKQNRRSEEMCRLEAEQERSTE